jgi:hypothetical protein
VQGGGGEPSTFQRPATAEQSWSLTRSRIPSRHTTRSKVGRLSPPTCDRRERVRLGTAWWAGGHAVPDAPQPQGTPDRGWGEGQRPHVHAKPGMRSRAAGIRHNDPHARPRSAAHSSWATTLAMASTPGSPLGLGLTAPHGPGQRVAGFPTERRAGGEVRDLRARAPCVRVCSSWCVWEKRERDREREGERVCAHAHDARAQSRAHTASRLPPRCAPHA